MEVDTKAAEPKKSVGEWAREKKPAEWLLAGARAGGNWEDEFPVLTETEFDAAIAAVADIRIG
jgi:hypothetical protein